LAVVGPISPFFARQSAAPQSPQLIPRTPEERERTYQNLHRISLSVEVSAPSGKAVSDLNQSDFTLFENGQVQKIVSFRRSGELAARNQERVIVVVDSVNNSSSKVTLFRKEITKYLKDGKGPLTDPWSIALFSDLGLKLGAPSRDRSALIRTLDELTGKIRTTSCADTIDFDSKAIKATDERDRELCWLSGMKNLPPCQKAWQETGVPMSEEQVREALLRLQVPETRIDEEIINAIDGG